MQDMNFTADTTSGEEGVALFRAIREQHADLPIILLTAWTQLETAVELVKAGAADYLAKPWDDHKLLATVENLLELSEATREVARLRDERRRRRKALRREIRPARPRVRVDRDRARRRARLPGRARRHSGADHRSERRRQGTHRRDHPGELARCKNGPFVTVNCGALPSELIEAELFGAEAGAYTGARTARAKDASSSPTAARCSSTRSATCRWPDR